MLLVPLQGVTWDWEYLGLYVLEFSCKWWLLFFELDCWPIVNMRMINKLSFSNGHVFAKLSRFKISMVQLCKQ